MGDGEVDAFLQADLLTRGLSLHDIEDMKARAPGLYSRIRALIFAEQFMFGENRSLQRLNVMKPSF